MKTELRFPLIRLLYIRRMIKKNNETTKYLLIMAALALYLSLCINMANNTLYQSGYWGLILVILLLCVAARNYLTKNPVIWVMVTGGFLKVSYILYTAVWQRQHDVIDFGAGEGHAAYIEYILYNKSLPDFDPRSVWAFFQPPLHHFISAVWMWAGIRVKIAERQLYENVQVLPLCYMLIVTLIVYEISKELNMTKKSQLITMLITAFHPIYVLMSGSINNDALSVCLSALSVYAALLWYKKPGILKSIFLGGCIGLAMMAKLSSALVAPGIGAMLLYRVIKDIRADKSCIKDYFLQLASFAVVVFPLGLWWPVRNVIKWNMPVNYIPEVGEQLEKCDMASRLFDIRTFSVYPALKSNGAAYDEYNVILAMFKTAFFGESDFSLLSKHITPFADLVFVFGIITAVIGIYAAIKVCTDRQSGPDAGLKIMFSGVLLGLLGGYFMFALSYSNFSAQDFRYSALAVSIMGIFTGLYCDRRLLKKKSVIVIYVSCIIFAAASFITYMLVGAYKG